MDLLEYQGKQLFRKHGVPTREGRHAAGFGEAVEAAEDLGYRGREGPGRGAGVSILVDGDTRLGLQGDGRRQGGGVGGEWGPSGA
jgi:hypothetical protein